MCEFRSGEHDMKNYLQVCRLITIRLRKMKKLSAILISHWAPVVFRYI